MSSKKTTEAKRPARKPKQTAAEKVTKLTERLAEIDAQTAAVVETAELDRAVAQAEDSTCNPAAPVAGLEQEAGTENQAAQIAPPTSPPSAARSSKHMDVTLTLNKEPRKSTRIVIFTGPLNSVQFLRTAFPGDTKSLDGVPETITVSGEFAEPKVKVEKIKETPAERKTRLAALPKLTLAEKVARAEKRTAELKAKLEAAAKKAEQPTA